jgi:hypothetical protein
MSAEIFSLKENFLHFVQNCLIQFIRLKFRNKQAFFSSIEKTFGIKASVHSPYLNVLFRLEEEKIRTLFREVFGISSTIEACHLYLFYKLLNNILYEATWTKRFSPFYQFVFGKNVKIRDKKELRYYAAEVVTKFNEETLCEKWIEFSSKYRYPLVIHLNYFIIGPAGFVLTPYHREKPILDFPRPILDIVMEPTQTYKEIVDWRKTNIAKFLSHIIDDVANGIENTCENYPIYKDYLENIGFTFSSSDWKKELPKVTGIFKDCLKKGQIPVQFYVLEQLTGMFLEDEEVVKVLNSLIANGTLVIKNETDIHDAAKVYKDSIMLKPKSWLAHPSIDSAKDLENMFLEDKRDFWQILKEVLEKGAIRYLEHVYEYYPRHFRNLLLKRGLYKFASSDLSLVPKKEVIRRILEGYGFQIPTFTGLDTREDMIEYFGKLSNFKRTYRTFDERILVSEIINFLRDGRDYAERILKELSFIISALVLRYREASNYQLENPFVAEFPLFLPFSYTKERDIARIKGSIVNFWSEIAHEEQKKKVQAKRKFTLGDWFSISSELLKYARNNKSFLNALPEDAQKRIENANESLKNLSETFPWLNKASHEGGKREIKARIGSREEALHSLLKLDATLKSLFTSVPPLIEITNEVSESRTGLKFYEAIAYKEDFFKTNIKIYGLRSVDLSYNYYLILQRLGERETEIVTYPLLITDVVDVITETL